MCSGCSSSASKNSLGGYVEELGSLECEVPLGSLEEDAASTACSVIDSDESTSSRPNSDLENVNRFVNMALRPTCCTWIDDRDSLILSFLFFFLEVSCNLTPRHPSLHIRNYHSLQVEGITAIGGIHARCPTTVVVAWSWFSVWWHIRAQSGHNQWPGNSLVVWLRGCWIRGHSCSWPGCGHGYSGRDRAHFGRDRAHSVRDRGHFGRNQGHSS